MKYQSNLNLNSVTIKFDELIHIAAFFDRIARKDSARSYSLPTFRIKSSDGRGYTARNHKEFQEALNECLENISTIYFYYSGKDSNLNIYFSKLGSLDVEIEADKKNDLLGLEDELMRALKRKNLNWLFHKFIGVVLIILFVYGITLLVTDILFPQAFSSKVGGSSLDLGLIVKNLSPLLIGLPIVFLGPSIYPKIVILHGDRRFGRDLRKDLKWITGIILLSIIIPYIVNSFSQ